jgi:hypothetical protein
MRRADDSHPVLQGPGQPLRWSRRRW